MGGCIYLVIGILITLTRRANIWQTDYPISVNPLAAVILDMLDE